ncbi:hypothetical protein [Streptomyces sp. Ru87]|uniref:hypothetical protein n=1 Tax=Streptomyces sp. Ru87 TaxID=2044307 RepID=UPI000BF57F07|nr:hypothetical protein [Streptomyces sp. Ru87]PGH47640.1 hypothetical protein CRI70_27460 [Streptomyces sp. Ru87]
MPDQLVGLRGREPVLQLVRDCLALPPDADRPVTVLLGPSGIGATDLHAGIKEQLAPEVPCAYLNFLRADAGGGLPLRTVLAGVLRELGRKMRDFSEPAFPRLLVGLIATEAPLDSHHRPQDRRSVSKLVRDRLRGPQGQGRYDSLLGPVTEVMGGLFGAPPGVSEATREVLSAVAPRPGRIPRRLLARGIAWYGGGRVPPSEEPADALLDLNSWQHGTGGQVKGPEDVERVLLRAFLADLRDHARGLLHHRSFLLLLDNCHTEAGRKFLRMLLELRHEDQVNRQGCDPLVTVASVHRWLDEWGPYTGAQWNPEPVESDRASLDHWAATRSASGTEDYWWYPLELRPLRLTETRDVCAAVPRGEETAPAVQRLTGGLPWAVRHTAATLAAAHREQPPPADDPSLPLRRVPGLRPPHPATGPEQPAPSLADASLGYLLEELAEDPGSRSVLIRWSAARDLSVCARVLTSGAGHRGSSLRDGLRERWLLSDSEDGRLVLHPWLRRLLLWELGSDEALWRDTHERLAEHYRTGPQGQPEQEPGVDTELEEAYHSLALGRTGPVAALLTRRFTSRTSEEWIRDFDLVTSAPNRLDKSRPPLALLDSLTPGDHGPAMSLASVVHRMVVARWIWSDPLSDPGRRLNAVLASAYDHVAALRSARSSPLYDEAVRYRQWRDQ